jgi:hypothetical protein
LEKGEDFHHNFLANLFQLTRTFYGLQRAQLDYT